MTPHDIGQRIRDIRKRLKLTQKELARILGVSPTSISAYEVGDAVPTLNTLRKLTKIADVSFDWLCAGSFMVRDPDDKLVKLTLQELQLLKQFRRANQEHKVLIAKLVEALVDTSKNNAD